MEIIYVWKKINKSHFMLWPYVNLIIYIGIPVDSTIQYNK